MNQTSVLCFISDKPWNSLRALAGIPHEHKRQSAAGMSEWVSNLLIDNPPEAWHDKRPEWMIEAEEDDLYLSKRQSNDRFWALPRSSRVAHRLLLPTSLLPDVYPIATHLYLFPRRFTPAAILGLLLEALGADWLEVDNLPDTPTSVNHKLRAQRAKRFLKEERNSIMRAERHISTWE